MYDVVNDGSPLPPERLAAIAAYLRRLELDRMGVYVHDLSVANGRPTPPFVMFAWISATSDVSVAITDFLTDYLDGHGADLGPLATSGVIHGMAAYLLEHPGANPASYDTQVAGIEYALHWYEQTLQDGDAHNSAADELLTIRDRGGLAEWYAANIHRE